MCGRGGECKLLPPLENGRQIDTRFLVVGLSMQSVNFEFIRHKVYQTRFSYPIIHSLLLAEQFIVMLNTITRPIISFTEVLCLFIGFCRQNHSPPSTRNTLGTPPGSYKLKSIASLAYYLLMHTINES